MNWTLAAAILFLLLALSHGVSLGLAMRRCRRAAAPAPMPQKAPRVSIVRPVCGLENNLETTLRSSFALDYPDYEIIFCISSQDDPAAPLVRRLIANHPKARAQMLFGHERLNDNPKLNNVAKGWRAASSDWIIMADSNVLMPRDYIQRLMRAWRPNTVRSVHRRSAGILSASSPNSNARSSTPMRRAGNMPPTASAPASRRARACCCGAI